MYDNPNQPHVLLGTRSAARGRGIEATLSSDERVLLLGVHQESETLVRALSASPTAILVVDSALSDCTAQMALYRASLSRPCHAFALSPSTSGEFATEALRAGAINCFLWTPGMEPSRDLVQQILRAAQLLPTPFQMLPRRADGGPRRPAGLDRFSSGRLVILVGERRGALLCDAVEHLHGDFPGSLLAYKPIHSSFRAHFAAHLARLARIRVSTPVDGEAVLDGTAYIFSRRVGLQVARDKKTEKLQFVNASAAPAGLTWSQQVLEGMGQGALSALVVAWGLQSDEERSFVALAARRGAAIAKKVPGGYQVRWPHMKEPGSFAEREFWDHVAQNIVSHGANYVLPADQAPIWPPLEHPALREGST